MTISRRSQSSGTPHGTTAGCRAPSAIWSRAIPLLLASGLLAAGSTAVLGQTPPASEMSPPPVGAPAANTEAAPALGSDEGQAPGPSASELLQVPQVDLHVGGVAHVPNIKSPVAGDPQAPERGMRYFNQMNCIGCHAANGAGGMGPSLSDSKFIFGNSPAQIFLSIYQGRAKGMPEWGTRLPDSAIWDIVAYVQSISKEPSGEWGKTTSVKGFEKEQVPAEYVQSSNPWAYTEPFSYGQKPEAKPNSAEHPASDYQFDGTRAQ